MTDLKKGWVEITTTPKGKTVETLKVELKNVLTPDSKRDIEVELIAFSRRDDEHVEFALAYADMLGGMPSRFRNPTDAALDLVRVFMAHKEDDANDPNSDYSCVYNDKLAARVLLNNIKVQKQINDFFANT